MVSLSSTLVETVSINYEDFSESFLTCGTCLCPYDAGEHTPKLLACSHTVCRDCLERILQTAQNRATTSSTSSNSSNSSSEGATIRCPICREVIHLPRGGIHALPPSFLVNQLLDLMARQRRQLVPTCSQHHSQELLFCETCDAVFCAVCTGGSHASSSTTSTRCDHTVIPFSIAIKRMSEILLYKANECISKLNLAGTSVNEEIHRLEHSADSALELVNKSFQELIELLEHRRQDMLQSVKTTRDLKKKALQEQVKEIEEEKEEVEKEVEGLQYQVEIHTITKKISELNKKLSCLDILSEPRENSFLQYEYKHNSSTEDLVAALEEFGRVRTSSTYPPNCTIEAEASSTYLEARATLLTSDFDGNRQREGGDIVEVQLHTEEGERVDTKVRDNDDGTYTVLFYPPQSGSYKITASVFGRNVKNSPYTFKVTEHNNPVLTFGTRGADDEEFLQPVGITRDRNGILYVLDTGNCRIKALSPTFKVVRHIYDPGLEGRSGTGIAVSSSDKIYVVNWRNRLVTELGPDGTHLRNFTSPELQEPIDVAVNSLGHVIVADNGLSALVVFDSNGKVLKRVGKKGTKNGQFGLISSIVIGKNDEIIVADSRIQVFNAKGEFDRVLFSGGKGKGHFGGITLDEHGYVLASRIEKSRQYVCVLDHKTGRNLFNIDSSDQKLKRPSGVCVDGTHVYVVDLGNDCLKKYRYK